MRGILLGLLISLSTITAANAAIWVPGHLGPQGWVDPHYRTYGWIYGHENFGWNGHPYWVPGHPAPDVYRPFPFHPCPYCLY